MWSINKTKRDNKRRYSEKTRKVGSGRILYETRPILPRFISLFRYFRAVYYWIYNINGTTYM